MKRNAIAHAQSQSSYCDEVDKMGQRWEAKTREDCRYLEGRTERLRRHLKQVEEALARSEINGMISANIARAGGEQPLGTPEPRLSFAEIDEDLIKSQRSYDQGLQEALLKLSPPKRVKSPEPCDKVRVMFEPFNLMYEYHHFASKAEEELIKDVIPLLEGARLFLQGRSRDDRSEKMLRLTPDLQKVELRQLGTELFKVDSFFWVRDLSSVQILSGTRGLLNRVNSPALSPAARFTQSPLMSSVKAGKTILRHRKVSALLSPTMSAKHLLVMSPTSKGGKRHFEFKLVLAHKEMDCRMVTD